MVFCYQNYSDLLWKKLFTWSRTFEIRAWRLRICKIVWDHENNSFHQWKVRTMFCNRMLFYLAPGGFSDQLEQLEFNLEKNIGTQIHAGKVWKTFCFTDVEKFVEFIFICEEKLKNKNIVAIFSRLLPCSKFFPALVFIAFWSRISVSKRSQNTLFLL